jgi:hypothetical protein
MVGLDQSKQQRDSINRPLHVWSLNFQQGHITKEIFSSMNNL